MKVEYDPMRDLLYLWFSADETKAARTERVAPGVHADFDRRGRLIGIEVVDASEVMENKLQFEVALAQSEAPAA